MAPAAFAVPATTLSFRRNGKCVSELSPSSLVRTVRSRFVCGPSRRKITLTTSCAFFGSIRRFEGHRQSSSSFRPVFAIICGEEKVIEDEEEEQKPPSSTTPSEEVTSLSPIEPSKVETTDEKPSLASTALVWGKGLLKLAVMAGLYVAHVYYLSVKGPEAKYIPKAVQEFLKANSAQIFWSDLLVMGCTVLWIMWRVGVHFWNKRAAPEKRLRESPILSLTGKEDDGSDRPLPWVIPKEHFKGRKIFKAAAMLTIAYIGTAYVTGTIDSILWEGLLPTLHYNKLIPKPDEDIRLALFILVGHLLWVLVGLRVLDSYLKPFFPPKGRWIAVNWYPGARSCYPFPVPGMQEDWKSYDEATKKDLTRRRKKDLWWLWSIVGYYVSSTVDSVVNIINKPITDACGLFVLVSPLRELFSSLSPAFAPFIALLSVLIRPTLRMLSPFFNPLKDSGLAFANPLKQGLAVIDSQRLQSFLLEEDLNPLPHLIVAIGPCVTGPIFEEVLYRGFVLPAIANWKTFPFMNPHVAVILSSLLFGLHHRNMKSLIPLSVLGGLWAYIYIRCGNLAAPIVIHTLWNNRVFLNKFIPKTD